MMRAGIGVLPLYTYAVKGILLGTSFLPSWNSASVHHHATIHAVAQPQNNAVFLPVPVSESA